MGSALPFFRAPCPASPGASVKDQPRLCQGSADAGVSNVNRITTDLRALGGIRTKGAHGSVRLGRHLCGRLTPKTQRCGEAGRIHQPLKHVRSGPPLTHRRHSRLRTGRKWTVSGGESGPVGFAGQLSAGGPDHGSGDKNALGAKAAARDQSGRRCIRSASSFVCRGDRIERR